MPTRRERVLLELEDHFSTPTAKTAAQVALLRRELDALDHQTSKTSKTMTPFGDPNGPIGRTGRRAEDGSKSIDKLSGRIAILARVGATVGPSVLPISALAVPAVAGLAAQLGFAALAGGTAIVAFQGLGDALTAMNKAHLEPTAENIEAARQAMQDLSPAARQAVVEMRKFVPLLLDARDAAASGFFPGFIDSMDAIRDRMPDVERILRRVGDTVGDILAAGAESLASDRWDEFFDFLATDASSALIDLSTAVGNITHGLAEMWMAFDPSNDRFSTWLVRVTSDFDAWAARLSQTQGFAEFMDYIETNGPRAAAALGAIGTAVLDIVEAIAPLAGASLKGLEIFGDVLSSIADSDLGTPIFGAIAAMSALRLATLAWGSASTTAVGTFVKNQLVAQNAIGQTYVKMAGLGKAAVALGGLALASSDMAGGFELSNTAAMAMMGTMAGPWGAAIGAGIGLTLDMAAANDELEAALLRVREAFDGGSVDEQRMALDQLKATTDQAADGMGNFASIGDVLHDPLGTAKSLFLQLTGAIDDSRGELDVFHDRIRARRNMGRMLAEPLGLAEDAFEDADRAMRRFTSSFERLTGLLDRRQSLIDYERALDELAKTAKKNEFNPDFERGRRGLEKLNDLVDAAIGRSQTLREEGDKLGAVRILRRAMDDLSEFGKRSPAAKRVVGDLIKELDRLDKKHTEPEIDADNKKAKGRISETEALLRSYDRKTFKADVDADASDAFQTFYNIEAYKIPDKIVTIRGVSGGGFGPQPAADGATVPKTGLGYADRHLYMLADGEEVVSDRWGGATKNRAALKAASRGAKLTVVTGLADGGTAGGGGNLSLEDLLAIAQARQQIRDLKKELAKNGKNRLEGIDRRIAELQIRAAEKEIRLAQHREEREQRAEAREEAREERQKAREKAQERREELRAKRDALIEAGSALSFDSIVPDNTPVTIAAQVMAEIADYRAQIAEAGGRWTRAMDEWATGLMATAQQMDHFQRRLAEETEKRARVAAELDKQRQALEALNATMETYAASVASGYLTDPFNRSIARPAGAAVPNAALSAAEAQLAAIRGSAGGDSVMAAAQASALIQQIAALRASIEGQAGEENITGAAALKETLETDRDNAAAMSEALTKLVRLGLDTTGAAGGLYQQLAASKDLATAQELAAMTREQIAEYEALWVARAEEAAKVAAQATQAVYGEERAELVAAINANQKVLGQLDDGITILNWQLERLGGEVRQGATAGAQLLQPQLREINESVRDVARKIGEQKKKAKV